MQGQLLTDAPQLAGLNFLTVPEQLNYLTLGVLFRSGLTPLIGP